MVSTVESTIENLQQSKTEDQFLDVTLTLLKLIQNVLGNPDKPRFKKIKRNTTFFYANPNVEDFLKVCGFEVLDNWMVFKDTEVAFIQIDTGKRHLLNYRKRINSLKAYEVPENSLRYSPIMLGKGKFASVFQGTWETYPVAIKALHPYCQAEAVADFRREADILRNLKHNNIIILHAVCLQNVNKRHAHVLELMDRTILDVLRTDPDISIEKLVGKALEVAAGLDHIHSKNILHCDIAARNILLNKQGIVKISDFGLARYADTPDCHLAGKTTVFPIRWTAPEVFTENVLTKASDVWSYGILCYELITRGKTPYGTFQNRLIKSKVSSGYRLPKSQDCPDDLYMLMLKCWNSEPNQRPSFQNIYQDLINMKLNFAKKQRFAVSFDNKDENEKDSDQTIGVFRRQSLGMRASIRKLVKSVSSKRSSSSWSSGDPGDETLTIHTRLLDTNTNKVTIHCKKDIRTDDVIVKALQKLGLGENEAYKYALCEVCDTRSAARRSQPNIETAGQMLPYVKLRGSMEQPVIIKAEWSHKDHMKYMICPRGAILRVLELVKCLHEGGKVSCQPYETRGYLLKSTGVTSGRHSLMWNKVWGVLDGSSLAVFEDEDCEDTWENGTIVQVEHATVAELKCDMFTVTDTENNEHSFQADDTADAFRWVEAINAARKAPPSHKLTEKTTLHSGKVLVMTDSDNTLNYGHKQVTLRKDQLFFYHNGACLSANMNKIKEVDMVSSNCSGQEESQPNGLKLVFAGTTYRLYPNTFQDFYSWSAALHKAVVMLGKAEVIQNSNLNQIKKLKRDGLSAVNGDPRSGSPDSGILSGSDSLRVTSSPHTASPELEDSFAELNRSIKKEDLSKGSKSNGVGSPREPKHCVSPPPLPPRNKPFIRTISPATRPLPTIPASTT